MNVFRMFTSSITFQTMLNPTWLVPLLHLFPISQEMVAKTLTQVNTIYYSIRAAFTPLNSHYVFPPVDFAADPIAVLQRISPALHQPSFNSSLLQDALFEACTNQNHPVALLLLQDNMHFVDLSEFKVWFIKLLIKPHHQLRNHQLVTRWFDNQVQADLGKVFSTPIARNLEELQYHLFLWEQLHFYRVSQLRRCFRYYRLLFGQAILGYARLWKSCYKSILKLIFKPLSFTCRLSD